MEPSSVWREISSPAKRRNRMHQRKCLWLSHRRSKSIRLALVSSSPSAWWNAAKKVSCNSSSQLCSRLKMLQITRRQLLTRKFNSWIRTLPRVYRIRKSRKKRIVLKSVCIQASSSSPPPKEASGKYCSKLRTWTIKIFFQRSKTKMISKICLLMMRRALELSYSLRIYWKNKNSWRSHLWCRKLNSLF